MIALKVDGRFVLCVPVKKIKEYKIEESIIDGSVPFDDVIEKISIDSKKGFPSIEDLERKRNNHPYFIVDSSLSKFYDKLFSETEIVSLLDLFADSKGEEKNDNYKAVCEMMEKGEEISRDTKMHFIKKTCPHLADFIGRQIDFVPLENPRVKLELNDESADVNAIVWWMSDTLKPENSLNHGLKK